LEKSEVFILEFSHDEATLGAAHAKKKWPNFFLDISRLQAYGNNILKRGIQEKPEKPPVAMENVLEEAGISWTDSYHAWKCALGKMLSARRSSHPKRSQKKTTCPSPTPVIVPSVPIFTEPNGQNAWMF